MYKIVIAVLAVMFISCYKAEAFGGGITGVKPCYKATCEQIESLQSELEQVKAEVEYLKRGSSAGIDMSDRCPKGFFYLDKTGECYKIITDPLTWTASKRKCENLSPTAHLAAIKTKEQDYALRYYLTTLDYTDPEVSKCTKGRGIFYTSGQRIDPTDCTSEFIWKLRYDAEEEITYKNWSPGEPNCAFNKEACLAYDTFGYSLNYNWNDVGCDIVQCSICEDDPYAE